MADRLYLMLLAAVACCALSGCATETTPEPEEPVAGTSGQTPAETPAAPTPVGEPEADLPALADAPIPPLPLEGLRLPPTEVALPQDDQFRATNPGSSRVQPPPRPDPGAVIVRPPAE